MAFPKDLSDNLKGGFLLSFWYDGVTISCSAEKKETGFVAVGEGSSLKASMDLAISRYRGVEESESILTG